MIAEYADLDAIALAELIRSGEVSAVEVVETAIAAAEELNPSLNAIVTPLFEPALESARAIEPAPLAGVPFLVKDMISVKDVPCSFGSRYWRDYIPNHDAVLVHRYRQAGLISLGQSNAPEVGLAATTEGGYLGRCHNPWNLDFSPGGSSGGAAAAVAARIVPAGHASDGGGSIRGPAFCCGLVGLKPTRGRISFAPDSGEGWGSLACNHALTRSVRDSAAILDVSHGPAPGDPYLAPHFSGSFLQQHTDDPGLLRVALDLNAVTDQPVHPDCIAAVKKVAHQLEQLGHVVEEASPAINHQRLLQSAETLVLASVANMVDGAARYLGRSPDPQDLEAHTWRCLIQGRQLSAEQYIQALNLTHHAGRQLAGFFSNYDLTLSPTHLHPPPPLGWLDTQSDDHETYIARMHAFWGFTSLYNATGCPAISLPLHESSEGLPVGAQFGAAFGRELLLLQIGHQLEQAMPWQARKPSTCA